VSLQETRFPERLKVAEVVSLFRSFYPEGRDVRSVISEVGLGEKSGTWTSRLSGGQRQRLALACALVGDPELLILDEPTTGLDPQARLHVGDTILGYRSLGRTVLVTTHYMEEAHRLCDRVAIIDRGTILACDTPARLRRGASATTRHHIQVDPMPAPGWESAVPDLRRAAIEGPEELVVDLGPGGDVSVLVAALAAAGSRITAISRVEPTLEDVFVEILGRASDDSDAAPRAPAGSPHSEEVR
jgi:ABC-2 type transport system ATP-binding protein